MGEPPDLSTPERADLLLCAHRWRVMGAPTSLALGAELAALGLVVVHSQRRLSGARYEPTGAGLALAVRLSRQAGARPAPLVAPPTVPTSAERSYARLRAELAQADPSLRERSPHLATRAVVDVDGQDFVRALYRAFDEVNAAHFAGLLAPPLVLITYTSPRAFGDHAARDVHGLRSVIRIHPKTATKGYLFAKDILLHEMIHIYAAEVAHDLEPGYRGHGPVFAAECNKLGAAFGLPAVGVKRRDGLPDCAQWPVCVRPAGYYETELGEATRKKCASRPGASDASPAADRDASDAGDVDEEPPPSGRRPDRPLTGSLARRAARLCRRVARAPGLLSAEDFAALERAAELLDQVAVTLPERSPAALPWAEDPAAKGA